jgi:methylthioribose-1-phosphate isomerase
MRAVAAKAAGSPQPEIAAALLHEAHAIAAEDVAINRRLGAHGATLLADGARVLTHCNAGALATAGHGTALGILRSARDAGIAVSAIACETRPYCRARASLRGNWCRKAYLSR